MVPPTGGNNGIPGTDEPPNPDPLPKEFRFKFVLLEVNVGLTVILFEEPVLAL